MRRQQQGFKGRARKRDANEPEIIEILEYVSASVCPLDKPLDLLVGYAGETELLEVKNGAQPPSWQRTTKGQQEFYDTWKGRPAKIVNSQQSALMALGWSQHDANLCVVRFEKSKKKKTIF